MSIGVRALHTTLAFSALSIKLNENELIHMDITVCWDGSCCQVRLQIKPKSSSDIFKVFSDLNYITKTELDNYLFFHRNARDHMLRYSVQYQPDITI